MLTQGGTHRAGDSGSIRVKEMPGGAGPPGKEHRTETELAGAGAEGTGWAVCRETKH